MTKKMVTARVEEELLEDLEVSKTRIITAGFAYYQSLSKEEKKRFLLEAYGKELPEGILKKILGGELL